MKKILITGKNSYVGTSLKKWLEAYPDRYSIDSISLRNDDWNEKDFSKYDVIFHVAAVVHRKEDPKMQPLYFKVNRDLPIEIATKAKADGVKQFIFMSTMAVYGLEGNIKKEIVIDSNTKESPVTLYGKSKLAAEIELKKLDNKDFIVTIVRPPIIYGPNCPGNYAKLKRLILISPLFPKLHSRRSMLSIDNLNCKIQNIIDNRMGGTVFPQDNEYKDIVDLVTSIAYENNRKIRFSTFLSIIIRLMPEIRILNKLFGSLIYDYNLSSNQQEEQCRLQK